MTERFKGRTSFMSAKKRFEFLEHTADIYVAAYGKNLNEALENAAVATFEVMTDTDVIEPKVEEDLEVEAYDEYALVYSWLEELLVKFELTGNLYSRFVIYEIEKTSEGVKLRAKIYGEPFDPEKHTQKVGVKAVTYHLMKIIKMPEKVTIKFILDI